MRWIDRPRKKTRREIVLEYIKFMKIMGYYPKLVSLMYTIAREKELSIYLGTHYQTSNVVSHKQQMIEYFITEIRNHCRGTKLDECFIREHLIIYPLGLYDYNQSWGLTYLLMSYFKEKHIHNCIIVGD